MDKLLYRINTFFEHLPDRIRRHRGKTWLLFVLLSIVIIAGAPRFKIDMTMEAYFQQDDPVKLAYDHFRAQFGGDETLYIIYRPKDGDIFSDASLRAVSNLQDELLNHSLSHGRDALGRITDVKTLVNVTYMEGSSGDLVSRQFVGDRFPADDTAREQLRQLALNHPDYPLLYLSRDSHYGGIMIRTDIGATVERDLVLDSISQPPAAAGAEFYLDGEELAFDEELEFDPEQVVEVARQLPTFERAELTDFADFMHAVSPLLEQSQYTEHLTFHPVGNPPMMTYFNDIIMAELGLVSGLCILLIAIVLALLFRSPAAVLWPLVIVIVSIAWVIGLIGWSGVTMTFMINIIVFLVLAVGVADAIHILSGYLFFRQQHQDHPTALRSVFKKSGLACFLTSLTTSIGLLALTLVPIVPIRNFGMFAALGVFLAFFFTVFVLPLMLDLWSPYSDRRAARNAGRQHLIQKGLQQVESLSYRYPRAIVITFMILGTGMVYGALQLKVDTNMIEILRPDTLIRQDVELADRVMGGAQSAEILIDTGRANALKDPRVLNRMEAIQDYAETRYPELVSLTNSLVNVTKSTYRALNEDRAAMFIIPQDPRVLEQTLFMFNNANPRDRRLLVADDYSSARITITLKNAGSYTYVPVMEDIQAKLEELFAPLRDSYPELQVHMTGSMSLMMELVDYVSWSQIESFGIALLIISLLLLLVFGSKQIGFIAIFPNLFPILCAFGVMGAFGLALDTDTLLVAPIIIGIAIDDTIHFLTHYRAGLYQHGNIPLAIRQTVREAGQAICFTTLVLAIGFLVFMFSSHNSMRNFGTISALAITVAVFADLLLLPALCVLFKADFKQTENKDNVEPSLA